jgi:type III pantothenate kinase
MMLLLDVGNTSVKWGVCNTGTLEQCGCFMHRGNDVRALADQSWSELRTPSSVFIASVAGEQVQQQLSDWIGAHWDIAPVFIATTAAACGVSNAYKIPGNLGVDRWAALVGIHHDAPGANCVIDCGTAITLDLLDATGLHRGGMILPGIEMLQQMLLKNTAINSEVRPFEGASLFSAGTEEAVNNGSLYMGAATIDRVVADMADDLGSPLQLVITGGDAARIQTLLACSARHDPELVLKGLAILAGEY